MATTQTLYMFSAQYPNGHSLLKLDITIPETDDGDWKISSPEIIRHFYSGGFNGRNHMRSGKFGLKIYILGGACQQITPEGNFVYEYPLDVMVFDPAAPDPSSDDTLKSFNVSPMNFGKLNPLMFEVAGKLFLLGCMTGSPFDELVKDKTFEEYDPKANQWTVRPSPPICLRAYIFVSALVLDCRTVVLQASGANPLYIFNPTTYEWTRLELPPIYTYATSPEIIANCCWQQQLIFGYNPVFIDDYFYVGLLKGLFRKVGPIPLSSSIARGVELLDLNPYDEFATVEWRGKSLSYPSPGLFQHINLFEVFHLSDWLFCVMETTTFHSNSDHLDPGDYCMNFDLYIHKVINNVEGSLKAECLHAANFTIDTKHDWIGEIISYHLMEKEMPSESDSSKRKKLKNIV